METKFEFGHESDERIVYVRPVDVSELPEEVQAQAGGLRKLYAVHDANGERLALVKERELAFILARQNDLAPVNVH
ncbi:DUF1150 domain-containing protein [Sinirhodobacter sp. WL0062]|uniref:DUF1150 domain-containing protein n=1 Tax=Rhodobacter flavimaris TaxID=2907145 RepID=A0ABS8YS62_9RHOB|nr:DUF1150 family protein [Sinirhodobacter sp. WL0062]MCE5972717.1 DUF1150 domain-containing protein [Sinirhodobacter sp. WL0062]